MRSPDRTATQICVVTSRNRNWHSKNTVRGNTFGFSMVGLGSHRCTCPCLLHGESDDCPTSDSLLGYLGNGKSPSQIRLPNHSCGSNYWEVLRLDATVCVCVCVCVVVGGGVSRILICSEKHHTSNVILPTRCWAGWANHHLISINLLVLELTCLI